MFKISVAAKGGAHPAYLFLAEQCAEVVRQGLWANQGISLAAPSWDDPIIYAHIEGKIIGAVQFEGKRWNRTVIVGWGATAPSYRRQGVNKSLIAELERQSYERGYVRIGRTSHANNEKMRAAFIEEGYTNTEVSYSKRLVPETDLAALDAPVQDW